MEFKSIENKNIVNLENCESEPIHIPGSIQPYGFLIAVKKENFIIDFCSENIFDFIGLRHDQLLGKNLSVIFNNSIPESFLDYIQKDNADGIAPFSLSISEKNLECISSKQEELIILEFDPQQIQPNDINSLYIQTREFVNILEQSNTLQSLCQRVADETRSITGYDRVMIYRFDKEYNGEVYAESRKEDIEPFLGLHYPHTDIPPQARELYMRNLLRMIVSVDYKPVPIYTTSDKENKNLDLSLVALRSVSPIHVQYLHNMGVAGTLTISLMHEGKLWGLIACHHYSPKYLDNQTRLKAKLQGHFLASQIKVREAYEEYDLTKIIDSNLQHLLSDNAELTRDRIKELVKKPELLQICNASAVAIIIDGETYSNGINSSEKELLEFAAWANGFSKGNFFYTDNLSSLYHSDSDLQQKAAGFIFYSVGVGNDCIIWFRQETIREVKWAGDPDKAILKDHNGLHPRKSFNLWSQLVKNRSNEWLKAEVNAALNFSNFLQRQLHLMFITEEELKYRELSLKLQKANSELENLNWIGTHDLKEPLRKIQVFASRILETSEKVPGNILNTVTRMNDSAARMQSLIANILSYSRAVNAKDGFKNVSLNDLLNSVINEIKDDIEDKKAEVKVEKLPNVQAIPFFLNQLFVNLIRNSLKFIRPGVSPVIKISMSPVKVNAPVETADPGKKYYEIIVEDNGIGFSNEYSESIFNVFTRLHTKDAYQGTGVGLALCKKIMENHEGFIIASGKENEGAIFKLYFPEKLKGD